jgi:hypothetical protein
MSNADSTPGQAAVVHEVAADESLSEALLAALSEVPEVPLWPEADADSGDRGPSEPLYSVVDLDALDSLFRPGSTGHGRDAGRVTFSYQGYDITVYSDGQVAVRRLADGHDAER